MIISVVNIHVASNIKTVYTSVILVGYLHTGVISKYTVEKPFFTFLRYKYAKASGLCAGGDTSPSCTQTLQLVSYTDLTKKVHTLRAGD